MAYIGNIPAEAYISISSQTFTTINGTSYTLSSSVESSDDIALFLNNVRQKPSTYTATSTTLTMGTATTTADELYCVYLGKALQTVNPGADSVGTSQIADLAVTDAKLAATQDLSTKTITLPASVSGLGTGITNAQLAGSIDVTTKITGKVPTANLGTGTASSSTYLAGDQTYKTIEEYDDNVVQSNIAMLGFKVAVNGSLTRYNLVDQSIDEFYDTSGIDASASTNEQRVASGSNFYYDGAISVTPTVTEDADTTATDGDYTVYSWTDTAAPGSYSQDSAQSDIDFLVIAGGGSAADSTPAGGGGAGGYRNSYGSEASGGGASSETALTFGAGTTYTITVGAGGAVPTGAGNNGAASSITGSDITDITTVGGGRGGQNSSAPAGIGGSGGGGAGQPSATSGAAGTANQGYAGGNSVDTTGYNGGGGGGASAVGANSTGTSGGTGGNGGNGLSSSITGVAVLRGGGGGGASYNGTPGTGGTGGGGNGATSTGTAQNGTPNTGGGGGGTDGTAGGGGSGIVILRRLTNTTAVADLTLQSTDVTAVSEPSYGEFVTLIENAAGTATLNTDIKGYVSRDSGVTFTQGTLVDEGTWGTNKKVLGFHDLDISSQPSGTSMCYKITTHNQSASSKETRIYATSIGWR